MLEGAGNIIEVDESGCFPGRGYKVDNKYAVSYTDYLEHHVTRGNADPDDDFVIRPGQSWCVISSAVEGDTHVTVYCPEIYNWDNNKVVVTTHWVDAAWAFPKPVVARCGTQAVLNTSVIRVTDKQPLAGYKVRYRILDGPPAVFLPGRTAEYVATSDLSGNAPATLAQLGPAAGVNKIGVEIIRAPLPTRPRRCRPGTGPRRNDRHLAGARRHARCHRAAHRRRRPGLDVHDRAEQRRPGRVAGHDRAGGDPRRDAVRPLRSAGRRGEQRPGLDAGRVERPAIAQPDRDLPHHPHRAGDQQGAGGDGRGAARREDGDDRRDGGSRGRRSRSASRRRPPARSGPRSSYKITVSNPGTGAGDRRGARMPSSTPDWSTRRS